MPDPMPRPTRFRFSDDFFGALIVDKFMKNSVPSCQLSALSSQENPLRSTES
jgi:hypothetical protein